MEGLYRLLKTSFVDFVVIRREDQYAVISSLIYGGLVSSSLSI
ncbi:MAG: hypothetical protein QXO78_01555 [Desulfurococcaceae archaeon]